MGQKLSSYLMRKGSRSVEHADTHARPPERPPLRLRLVLTLGCCFWFLGIIYVVVLFPTISLSTGEDKPRGMYVDEHAIMMQGREVVKRMTDVHYHPDEEYFVNKSTADIILLPDENENHNNVESMNHWCEFITMKTELLSSRPLQRQQRCVTISAALTAFIIDGPSNGIGFNHLETTVVVLTLPIDCPHGQSRIRLLLLNLINAIQHAKWLARKVVIIMHEAKSNYPSFYGDCIFSSSHLSSSGLTSSRNEIANWLDTLSQSNVDISIDWTKEDILQDKVVQSLLLDQRVFDWQSQFGLFREAYVIDLQDYFASDPHQCTFQTISSQLSNDNNLLWSGAQLKFQGKNGNLPNMDMLSYVLSIYGTNKQVSVQTAYHHWIHAHVQKFVHLIMKNLSDAFQLPLSSLAVINYNSRLTGLLEHIWTMMESSNGNGYHSDFLQQNIDSITLSLKPISTSIKTNELKQSQSNKSSRHEYRHKSSSIFTSKDLFEVILHLVYVSNNLHEELHHSHFFYLMMGDHHFVGINEFGIACGILIAPLLLIYFYFSLNPFVLRETFLNAGSSLPSGLSMISIAIDFLVVSGILISMRSIPFIHNNERYSWVNVCFTLQFIKSILDVGTSIVYKWNLLSITRIFYVDISPDSCGSYGIVSEHGADHSLSLFLDLVLRDQFDRLALYILALIVILTGVGLYNVALYFCIVVVVDLMLIIGLALVGITHKRFSNRFLWVKEVMRMLSFLCLVGLAILSQPILVHYQLTMYLPFLEAMWIENNCFTYPAIMLSSWFMSKFFVNSL